MLSGGLQGQSHLQTPVIHKRSGLNDTWHWPGIHTWKSTLTGHLWHTNQHVFLRKVICCKSSCMLHWKYTQQTRDNRHVINQGTAHPQSHTSSVPAGSVLLRLLRRQLCQNNVLVSLLFAVVLLCFFYPKKKQNNTESDLLCILLMHFSQVTLKTPCSSTLKSNLALAGLKAHVKLKATLGVGMKNWVAPYINQVEHSTQHLDRRNGIF